MDKETLKFINLLNHLPPDANPYLEAANLLEKAVHSPSSPPASRRFRIALLVFMEIMLFQSSILLYQRLRISQYPKIRSNVLGLVILNISYIASICYLFYSILTIYTLLVKIAMDLGRKMDEALMLLVFGLKFFTVILGSWTFLWVCACQCAMVLWNSDLASRMDRELLKTLIKWVTSSLILLSAFGPLPFITWQYIKAYIALNKIETIAHSVMSKLRSKAASYDPDKFSPMSVLSLLLPAKQLIPLQARLESGLRLGQKLYMVDLGFLSLVYIPLLITSLTSLYKQSRFQSEIDAATRSSSNHPAESVISRRIRHQRQRLVYHAIGVYLATSIHLPILVCEIILSSSPGFVHSPKWHEMTFLGLTAPLAFTGNLILLICNLHSYLVLKEKTRPRMRSLKPSDIKTADMNMLQKISSLAFVYLSYSESDDDTVASEDLEANEKDHTAVSKIHQESESPNMVIKVIQSRVSMSG